MKKYLFLVLFSSLLMACEKDNLNVTDLSAKEENVQERRIAPPTFEEDDADDITTCGNNISYLSSLQAITSVSSVWSPFPGSNPNINYLDDVLEQAFHCSPYFSTCTIRPAHPPINVDEVDFDYGDGGYVIYGPYDDEEGYHYLSEEGVSIDKVEELKQHFACTIKNYQNSHYSNNTYVHKVEFSGYSTLCTCSSGNRHYLRATVTFNTY